MKILFSWFLILLFYLSERNVWFSNIHDWQKRWFYGLFNFSIVDELGWFWPCFSFNQI